MDILDWPTSLGIAQVDWTLDRPADVSASAYTGVTSVAATPWFGKWSAKVALPTSVGEDKVLALRGLISDLDGQVNAVRVPATEGLQKNFPKAVAGGAAAQGASVLTISGCILKKGLLFTVNDELKIVKSISGSSVTFRPPLRADVANGTVIEVGNPTALMRLSSSSAGWSVRPGKQYSASYDFEEAF